MPARMQNACKFAKINAKLEVMAEGLTSEDLDSCSLSIFFAQVHGTLNEIEEGWTGE